MFVAKADLAVGKRGWSEKLENVEKDVDGQTGTECIVAEENGNKRGIEGMARESERKTEIARMKGSFAGLFEQFAEMTVDVGNGETLVEDCVERFAGGFEEVIRQPERVKSDGLGQGDIDEGGVCGKKTTWQSTV